VYGVSPIVLRSMRDPVGVRMAYRCRAYPDGGQQQMLARTFGCVRLVWNQTLAERRRLYHGEGKGLSYAASDAALTVMKRDPDLAFLGVVNPRCARRSGPG
jgi:putative transposase